MGAIDMIFGPVSEAHLEEGQSCIMSIAACEVGVELQCETLQFGIGPVGIPCRSVVVGVLGKGLGIVLPLFDIRRHGGGPSGAIDIATGRIFIAEAGDELMTATRHIIEDIVEPGPVVLYGAVGLAARDDLTGQAVGEFQLYGDSELKRATSPGRSSAADG